MSTRDQFGDSQIRRNCVTEPFKVQPGTVPKNPSKFKEDISNKKFGLGSIRLCLIADLYLLVKSLKIAEALKHYFFVFKPTGDKIVPFKSSKSII